MPSRETVQAFIALVERGQYVRAIEDFYHPNASMQENGQPPWVGRQVLTFLVDGDRVVINWVFEITGPDGNARVLDELALQLWDGDRIARERFYYDPAQIRPPRA